MFTALPAMLLSGVYLSITPMDKIYGGAPFAIGLWGIAILTTYTLVAAWVHILRGEVVAHRTTMVLNFAAMLIAPLLRFWWMCIGWLFLDVGLSQATAHVAVLMFLGLQVVIGAIVVLHFQASSLVGPSSEALHRFGQWTRVRLNRWVRLLHGVSLVSSVLLLTPLLGLFIGWDGLRDPAMASRDHVVYATHYGFFWVGTVGLLGVYAATPSLLRRMFERPFDALSAESVPFVVSVIAAVVGWMGLAHGYGTDGIGGVGAAVLWSALAISTLTLLGLWAHSLLRSDPRQLREMTLHLFMLCMTPVSLTVFQMLFLAVGFTWEDAFLSGAVLAPPLNLSVSFYYTVYGRRVQVPSRQTRIESSSPSVVEFA